MALPQGLSCLVVYQDSALKLLSGHLCHYYSDLWSQERLILICGVVFLAKAAGTHCLSVQFRLPCLGPSALSVVTFLTVRELMHKEGTYACAKCSSNFYFLTTTDSSNKIHGANVGAPLESSSCPTPHPGGVMASGLRVCPSKLPSRCLFLSPSLSLPLSLFRFLTFTKYFLHGWLDLSKKPIQ